VGQSVLPYIIKKGTTSQLIINEKPYLILGGELGNSSASSITYMNSIWPTLEQMNLNTLLVPVYWELLIHLNGQRHNLAVWDDISIEGEVHLVRRRSSQPSNHLPPEYLV
jgi:hypothetical protein